MFVSLRKLLTFLTFPLSYHSHSATSIAHRLELKAFRPFFPGARHTICHFGVLYRSKSAVRLKNKEATICGIAVTVAGTTAGGLSCFCSSAAAATMVAAVITTAVAVVAAALVITIAGGLSCFCSSVAAATMAATVVAAVITTAVVAVATTIAAAKGLKPRYSDEAHTRRRRANCPPPSRV
ncbi:hypothetical protein SDC9_111010 [bioreactor metagenome]|uniref:Uncharacterized protein n=1 Tax=bioreactor metagenome TaxID=1076179 RepID=A0A645BQL7_9ZZZZ